MKYVGVINHGKIDLQDQEQFFKQLKKLEGKDISLELKQRRKKGSPAQRGYYRGVILPRIAETMHMLPAEAHGIVKYLFQVDSIEEMETREKEILFSKLRMWCNNELGLWIPKPNEPDYYEQEFVRD